MVEQFGREDIERSRQSLGYSQQLTNEIANQQNLAQQLVGSYDTLEKNFNKTIQKSNDLTKSIENQFNILKDLNTQGDRWYELKQKLDKAQKDFNEALEKSKDIETQLSAQGKDAAQKYVDGLTARYKIEEELNTLAKRRADVDTMELNLAQGIGNVTQGALDAAKQAALAQESKVKTLNEQLAIVEDINSGEFKTLSNLTDEDKLLLQKLTIQQKSLDVARNTEQNHRKEFEILDKNLSTYEKIKSTINTYVKNLKEVGVIKDTIGFFNTQLTAIGFSFGAILKNVLEYGKTLTDSAKQLGISVDGARVLANSYENTALRAKEINANSNSAFLTIKNQFEAQQQLNNALGTAALMTEKQRVDQVTLTKQMGLSAEEAANVFKLGLLNRQSAEATAKAIGTQVIEFRKATNISLDFKKVLNDVAKVSGQLAVQYQNNPELLAKAVIQAKELGLTLEQTAGMADKLLNFETSIEAELKAELLTGRALNLEQARYLALMGDSAGAAKELMNNVGGLAEFQKLNVLQQRALADAIGMSASELSDALKQQELLKNSAWSSTEAFKEAILLADTEAEKAEIIAKIKQADNADQLMKQYQQISAQEKFNQTIERLKEMVSKMVDGPLGKFIDRLSNAVSLGKSLEKIFNAISFIIGVQMIKGLVSAAAELVKAIAPASRLAVSMAGASAAAGLIGGLLTIGAVLAAMAAVSSALPESGETISTSVPSGGGVETTSLSTEAPKGSTTSTTPQVFSPTINLNMNGQNFQSWNDENNKYSPVGNYG